jgi:hypothetical protein
VAARLAQRRRERLRQKQRRFVVDRHEASHHVGRRLGQPRGLVERGVVDEHVESRVVECVANGSRRRDRIREVDANRLSLHPCSEFGGFGLAAVESEDDAKAFAGEFFHDRPPDAFCAAGHQRHAFLR